MMIDPQPTKVEPKLVEQYWQWLYKLSKNINPALNNDGDRDSEANKASGNDVYFLSFALSGESLRNLGTIDVGRKFLVPSLSMCVTEGECTGLNQIGIDDELKKIVDVDQNNIKDRKIELDGYLVTDMEGYRVRTNSFKVDYPEKDPIFSIPEKRWGNQNVRAMADGVYILWQPKEGRHRIHFEGRIPLPEKGTNLEDREYTENVTYTFTSVLK